ncbi:hypothetical protein [Desulfofustis glycolicus]|uniref:hypothetical protein n=1 Tax=Desulfofustis glycolicus TaxID=51195 RepID=UPI0009341FF9|nr:hypothetical protein [Desulfofustis glycolicus]
MLDARKLQIGDAALHREALNRQHSGKVFAAAPEVGTIGEALQLQRTTTPYGELEKYGILFKIEACMKILPQACI